MDKFIPNGQTKWQLEHPVRFVKARSKHQCILQNTRTLAQLSGFLWITSSLFGDVMQHLKPEAPASLDKR